MKRNALKENLSQQVEFLAERLGFLENAVRGHTQSIGNLRLPSLDPPRLTPVETSGSNQVRGSQRDLADKILDLIDISHLLRVIQRRVDFTDLTSHTADLEARVGVLEDDFLRTTEGVNQMDNSTQTRQYFKCATAAIRGPRHN